MATDYERMMAERAAKKAENNATSDDPTVTGLALVKEGGKHISGSTHAVRRLNKDYAYVLMGKHALVVTNDPREERYGFLYLDTFKSFLANDKITVNTSRGQKEVSVYDIWLAHEERRTYRKVDFKPNGKLGDDTLNMWRGFAVEPFIGMSLLSAARGCRLFLKHIRDNICKGDRIEYRYFIRWCADLFQNPEVKSGVAISISGRKGTGKSKVSEVLKALLGGHQTIVSTKKHLVGGFNSHLAQAILVVAEEAVWAGDKEAEGALKHMITSPDGLIEQKFVDAAPIKSFARVMFIGNDPWIFPANEDERRLFALECGAGRIRDYAYFEAIDQQLFDHKEGKQGNPDWRESFGIRSLMTFFMSVNLSSFSIRKIPETEGLMNQRESSMESHVRFIRECLDNHTIGVESDSQLDFVQRPAEWGDEGREISKEELYNCYLNWHKKHHRSQPTSNVAFWKWTKNVMGWMPRRGGSRNQRVQVVFVHGWKESRLKFMSGVKVDLEDGEF